MAVYDPITPHRWRVIFAERPRSGLTIMDFCQARMINMSAFFRWRNILGNSTLRIRNRSRHSCCCG